jgi:Tfp pilus assembly protein PilE
MLEAVVVVGVLLALAVGGFFAYGTITENAKRAAVKSAASQVHTAVLTADSDGDSSTTTQDVLDKWNASTDKIRVDIRNTSNGPKSAEGDFCIQATDEASIQITALSGSCTDVTGGSTGNGGNDNGNNSDSTNGLLTLADVSANNLESKGNQQMVDYMNAVLGTYNAEELYAAQTEWSDNAALDAYDASPGAKAFAKTADDAPYLFTYQRMLDNAVATYSDVAAAKAKAEAANDFYYSSVENSTAESQKAAADAYRELYLLVLSKPSTAMPTFNLGQYTDMTVTAGSTTPSGFTITVPNANSSSVVTNIEVKPRHEWSRLDSPGSLASYNVVNGVPTISGTFDNFEQYYPAFTGYNVVITADVDGVKTYGIIHVTVGS